MTEQRSLLDLIRESLQDGRLPDSFSLPKEEEPGAVRFADGAKDGIAVYHMGRPEITEAQKAIIRDAFIYYKAPAKAMARMQDFFAEVSPLRGIDAIQNYVYDNTEILEPNAVFHLADICLHSSEVDFVKLGLILTELFTEPENEVKEIIRTLGLSDEFTIFSVFNMQRWETGNAEIFALAQRVRGWGRIHAIERLQPETQEIRDWLFAEGVDNDVVPAYSALEVFEKAGVAERLKGELTDAQLDQAAHILDAMLDEGPVRGISALPETDAAALIGDFLRQAQTHALSLKTCELLYMLSEEERFSAYAEQCRALLQSPGCRETVEQALSGGKAVQLAKTLGIPYKEPLFDHMQADFDSGYANCGELTDDPQYREAVIALFRERLPLEKMRQNGTFAEFNKLAVLLQALRGCPLCGEDLVIAATEMPDVRCRFMAVNAASDWCLARNCRLPELSPALAQAMERMKAAETNERVKQRLAESGF